MSEIIFTGRKTLIKKQTNKTKQQQKKNNNNNKKKKNNNKKQKQKQNKKQKKKKKKNSQCEDERNKISKCSAADTLCCYDDCFLIFRRYLSLMKYAKRLIRD